MKTCTNCSQEKNLEEFYYKKTEKRHTSWCRKCYETYRHKRWIERKRKLIEVMGGKCEKCGYNRCLAALEFHHKDPKDKDAHWNKVSRWAWDKVMREIKKCSLLCSNCHREHHASDDLWTVTPVPGFLSDPIKSSGICAFCGSDVYKTKYCCSKCKVRAKQQTQGLCPICKDEVYGTKYCSNKCRALSQRKTKHPTKPQLSELIEKNSWTGIGRKFGVSDNAVRKWAKQYSLI